MTELETIYEKYAVYEKEHDPTLHDRHARRHRKAGTSPRGLPSQAEILEGLAEPEGLEAGFDPTYTPTRHEAGWLLKSLGSFYDQGLITDILARVHGGKEATVYRCKAHPRTGAKWLAAKVYRPRVFRTLRNDSIYRRGRQILTATGRPVNKSDHRTMRAIGKKTAYGVQVQQTSWLMHEYTAMERLHRDGGAVPPPVSATDNAILMGYVGDERVGAPTLNRINLDRAHAQELFDEVLRNVELMLRHGYIHGDLSAYNVLYWEGQILLIDFPQVIDVHGNPRAEEILGRDITRVCQYFGAQGVDSDPQALLYRFWSQYGARDRQELWIGVEPEDAA